MPRMLNAVNNKGKTPLMVLCLNINNREEVEELLKMGADPNIQDKKGETALYKSLKKDNREVIEVLLKYSAKTDISTEKGKLII